MNEKLLDYMSEGVVILRKDSKVLFTNQTILRYLGYKEKIEDEIKQNIILSTNEVIKAASEIDKEIYITLQDNRQNSMVLKGKVFEQQWCEEICYWVLIKVNEEVGKNELSMILDNMPYCIWIADEKEKYKYMNRHTKMMFKRVFSNNNKSEEKQLKQSIGDLYQRKIKENIIKKDQEILKQGVMVNEERIVVNEKGDLDLQYQILKVPMFDKQNVYKGYVGIVEYKILKHKLDIKKVIEDTVIGDITDKKRFYSQLVNLLEFTITAEKMLQDKMLIILRYNPEQNQVEEISRLQKAENTDLMKTNLTISERIITNLIKQGNTWSLEVFEKKIGCSVGYTLNQVENYYIHINPIEYNNEFMGVILTIYSSDIQVSLMDVCIINKVCQQIAMILKSVSYAVEFEQEWSKRKALEAESTAYKKALQLETLKTEFLANISHELKTPLNIIYSVIQSFEVEFREIKNIHDNRESYSRLIRYQEITKQNIYRLLRLINNITDISKIGAGYYDAQMINGDIVAEVEDITMSVVEYFKKKEVSIIFDTEVEELEMAYDPEKIERIMLNLLSNAVKYTSSGGRIEVNLNIRNQKLIISVKDTGVGIPKEKQNMIFERFAQVDSSFSRKCEGSGIGLALVKSLVERQGGTITVESEEGKGSTFSVILPITYSQTIKPQVNLIGGREEQLNYKCRVEFSDIYNE